MRLVFRRSIDDVMTFFNLRQEFGDFFWWVLKVVIKRNDQRTSCCTDSAQKSIVLSVVSSQLYATYASILVCNGFYN